MASLFDGPLTWFAGKLAEAINRTAQNDTESKRYLRKLEGRALGVEVVGPGIKVLIQVENGIFTVQPFDEELDSQITWIRATPGSLMALAASGGKAAAGNLEVSGDADTGQRFQQFFKSLKPDLEESLSRVFGDVIGVQLARILSSAQAWASKAGETVMLNLSEYLTEESRQLVTQTEMEEFLDEVDDLRDDIERLEARIKQLDQPS